MRGTLERLRIKVITHGHQRGYTPIEDFCTDIGHGILQADIVVDERNSLGEALSKTQLEFAIATKARRATKASNRGLADPGTRGNVRKRQTDNHVGMAQNVSTDNLFGRTHLVEQPDNSVQQFGGSCIGFRVGRGDGRWLGFRRDRL